VVVGRSVTDEDRVTSPPERVWEAISAQLADDPSLASVSRLRPPGPGTVSGPARERARGRWWSTTVLVAASVASLAVGVVAASVVNRGSPPTGPDQTVLAQTNLSALPDHTGQGAAQVVTRDGNDYLQVDATGLSAGSGFYEVWLIDPKTFQMVGLGSLENDQGLFAVPPGLDLSKYRVVDVSLEPLDGNPLHSKDSVVRGELQV
jgi:hypothetical protein